MDNTMANWQPTPAEVAAIVQEMRPLIRQLAEKHRQDVDTYAMAAAS
jgi:hypothetical protein